MGREWCPVFAATVRSSLGTHNLLDDLGNGALLDILAVETSARTQELLQDIAHLSIDTLSRELRANGMDHILELRLVNGLDAATGNVFLEDLDLRLLLLDKVTAASGAELVSSLLGGAGGLAEEGNELGVGLDRLSGLAGVEDGSKNGAQNGQARGILGAHGGLEVTLQLGIERRGRRGLRGVGPDGLVGELQGPSRGSDGTAGEAAGLARSGTSEEASDEAGGETGGHGGYMRLKNDGTLVRGWVKEGRVRRMDEESSWLLK